MLDPSTNINPLVRGAARPSDNYSDGKGKEEGPATDVSKHTFYVVNSQVKLKLHARTEVTQLASLQYPI